MEVHSLSQDQHRKLPGTVGYLPRISISGSSTSLRNLAVQPQSNLPNLSRIFSRRDADLF